MGFQGGQFSRRKIQILFLLDLGALKTFLMPVIAQKISIWLSHKNLGATKPTE